MGSIVPDYLFYFQDFDDPQQPIIKLEYDIDGWKNYGVTFGRETGVSNVVKSYTHSWRFFKQDAAYLKQKLFQYGTNRRIRLIVKQLVDYLTERYEVEYTGFIDLTQIKIEANSVTAPVSEAGLFKALENRWNEKYRLPLDCVCNVTGASFSEATTFQNETSFTDQPCTRQATIGYVILGGTIESSDNSRNNFFFDTTPRYLNAYLDTNTGDHIIDTVSETDAFFKLHANVIQTMEINYNIAFRLTIKNLETYASRNLSSYALYLVSTDLANVANGANFILSESNSEFMQLQFISQDHNLINGWGTQTFSIGFSGQHRINDYDCANGKAFFLLARVMYGIASARELWGNSVTYDWDNRYCATVNSGSPDSLVSLSYNAFQVECVFDTQIVVNQYVSAKLAVQVFTELLEQIGENYHVDTQLHAFSQVAKDDLLTSGTGLRWAEKRLIRNGREHYVAYFPQGHLETSLQDFLKFAMVVYNYRLAVDYDPNSDSYTVQLLHHDTFYQSRRIAELTAINNFAVRIDRDKLYTSIACGYHTRDDAINGLSEYNCIFNWLTCHTEIEEKPLDLISPYSASTRTIETYIYENYDNQKDSDEKDNEIFIIGAEFQHVQHIESSVETDYSQYPIIDVIDRAWNDVLVVINNPAYNGGYAFVSFMWYKNDFYHPISNFQYMQESSLAMSLANGDIYFCVLTTNSNDTLICMYPFDSDYVIAAPSEVATPPDVPIFAIRRTATVQAGFIQPNYAWNVDFTPKRILLTHRKELNSYFAFESGKHLVLNTCERNSELVAGGIIEKEDIIIGNDACFLPLLIEISTPTAKRMIHDIEANRIGYFEFEFQGRRYKGFIAEGANAISINPMEEKASTLTLISGVENIFV